MLLCPKSFLVTMISTFHSKAYFTVTFRKYSKIQYSVFFNCNQWAQWKKQNKTQEYTADLCCFMRFVDNITKSIKTITMQPSKTQVCWCALDRKLSGNWDNLQPDCKLEMRCSSGGKQQQVCVILKPAHSALSAKWERAEKLLPAHSWRKLSVRK